MLKLYGYNYNNQLYEQLDFKYLVFPGGEPHVELKTETTFYDYLVVDARIGNATDLIGVCLIKDAIKRLNTATTVDLFIPYFPGARQDRYEPGFSLSVKVYTDIINSLEFNKVIVVDPHSPVTSALLNNCRIEDHTNLILDYTDYLKKNEAEINAVIAPDLGAAKRAQTIADMLGVPMLQVLKKRDPKTGKLSNLELIDTPNFKVRNCLVVDDICDGGGTFKLLSDYFRLNFPTFNLYLWVTHGIFSKGFEPLVDYRGVACTDSFPSNMSGFGNNKPVVYKIWRK